MKKNILWLRNDLRFEDNTALINAVNEAYERKEKLILVFHFNEDQFKVKKFSHDYFFSALNIFYNKLKEQKLDILFLKGDIETEFNKLINKVGPISNFYFNISERGYGLKRDKLVNDLLKKHDIKTRAFYDKHLNHSNQILNNQNGYYKVFTYYYKKWILTSKKKSQNIDYKKMYSVVTNEYIGKDNQKYLDEILSNRKTNFENICGEDKADLELDEFISNKIYDYENNRDYPILNATSGLSKYLSSGEISIRKIYEKVLNEKESAGKTCFLKEIAWRDFYNMIYHFNEDQAQVEIIEKYRTLKWEYNEHYYNRFIQGKTGFPIIDAAIRKLNLDGTMHNRLRMIVGSFFVKDLHLDWRLGEKYFSEMLIDYDTASNIGGWQWVASVGTDACPYFRIFNPFSQSEKFDKDGEYIKKYIPELRNLPSKYIHEPFKYKEKLKKEYGIDIEKIYYEPIVNHKEKRQESIEKYKV